MKIVILSRGPKLYSTTRLVQACEERNHEVVVLDPLKCTLMIAQGKPEVHYGGKNIGSVDAVVPRIGASWTFYGASVVRQFEMMHVFSSTSSLALVRSKDKLRSLQIMSKAGIGMPKTAFARKTLSTADLIKYVGGAPVVVKLLEGTQGLGVVLAETSKAAKSVIEAFYGLSANILVQEFIEEAGGADFRVLVVDGEVVGAMKRQGPEGEFRSNLHRGGTATVAKLSKKEKNIAIRAAQSLGLNVAGVDLLRSSRGPLVMEVNSSPGLEGIETATEVDIAGKIIEYVEQNAVRKGKRKQRDNVGA